MQTSEIVLGVGVLLVGVIAAVNFTMLSSYGTQTTGYMAYLNQKVDGINITPTNLTPVYSRIYSDEQAITELKNRHIPDDKSIEIAALQNETARLKAQLKDYNQSIYNITRYLETLNCTNVTINNTVVYNNTINQTANYTTNQTCKQRITDTYGLGQSFDILYCCESRAYGFSDDCCSCYR